MDLNFADLKKEAAATVDDIFSHTTEVSRKAGDSDAGKKDLDLEHAEALVQSMSAGAKEAQEQLDAKFAQKTNDFDSYLTDNLNDLSSFGAAQQQQAHKALASVSNDFMNAERDYHAVAGAGDVSKAPAKSVLDEDLFGFGNGDGQIYAPTAPLAPVVPTAHFYLDGDNDDDDVKPLSSVLKTSAAASSKNSDTDESPSVSYNPSPIKKNPVTAALKEQDNEKFISSEDLLGDFKGDERTATPEFKSAPTAVAKTEQILAGNLPVQAASVMTTDLDDDDNFLVNTKPSVVAAHSQVEQVKDIKVLPVPPPKPVKAQAPQPVARGESKSTVPQPNVTLVEEIFYKYGLVESLIYWRDVKKSGIVFGAGLITLLAVSCFSVISVFAYLSLLTLFGTVAFRIYKTVLAAVQKTSEGHPFKEYLELDLTLSQEKIQNVAGVAVAHVNGFTAELRRLFLVENMVDSIKFGVILWVLTYIGAWFNGMTLVLLAFVSLFTLPKVYENNKQTIDTNLDLVRSKITEITDKIKVAIPIGNKPAAAETDKDK